LRLYKQLKTYDHNHHHHIYSPIITSSQQYHKNSHTIKGLPEKALQLTDWPPK